MKILITGTARSGTTFVASTLQNLGIRASHEVVYKNDGGVTAWPDVDHCEISWAAPKCRDEWPEDMTILHLVRHPFRVIESYTQGIMGKHQRWLNEHWLLPEMFRPRSVDWKGPDFVAWHIITWNRLIERYAKKRFQVDIASGKSIYGIFNHLLLKKWPAPGEVVNAMDNANRNSGWGSFNHRPEIKSLEDFHEDLREPLACLCKDYGYE